MKLKVAGSEYVFIDDIRINLTLDAVASSFQFKARFNTDNPVHVALFRPLTYAEVEIFDNQDNLLLTGVLVSPTFTSTQTTNLASFSGYSKGGVLNDCNIPLANYPLESINRSLKDIAQRLLAIFSLQLVISPSVQADANAIYERTTATPGESVAGYLAKLASQRNIVLGHDARGNILLYRPDPSAAPAYSFTQRNTQKMTLGINGQSIHSSVEVIRQPSEEDPGVSLADRALNPLISINRPGVSVLTSGKETDTKKAADNKMAAELTSIVLTIALDKQIPISPGMIIEAENPEVFLFTKTRFMVSAATIEEKKDGQSTVITAVLPESFTGQPPKRIFS